jgi:hypothetical protein
MRGNTTSAASATPQNTIASDTMCAAPSRDRHDSMAHHPPTINSATTAAAYPNSPHPQVAA